MFDSEENEERDFLKNILHRLYAKLVPRRKMIRKAITDCFHILIHEIHKFNGASELLDILASIISGFAVPLREEHVIFFKNIIIPLHKVQTSNLYFDNLIRCSMLFLTKDNTLAIPVNCNNNLVVRRNLKILAFCKFHEGNFILARITRGFRIL